MKTLLSLTIIFAALVGVTTSNALGFDFSLSEKDLKCIGDRIFQNECSGKPERLVYWDDREPFPSLGMGHFIWYPENFKGRFHESFPEFVRFLKKRGREIPDWLWNGGNVKFTWQTREKFLAERNSPKMLELRRFMESTMDLQTVFMLERLRKFHSNISVGLFFPNKNPVQKRFERLAVSTQGIYALMDYLNFKGDGLKASERYKGYRWGLKQVLEEMDRNAFDKDPLAEFSRTAFRVLERRVRNSDPENEEALRLPGWEKRTLSYLEFSC